MLNKLIKIKRKRKLIGRGGDRGGTSCRGHKGQKARSGGGVRRQSEGGQTSLVRRMPKRGFNNNMFASKRPVILTLSDLETISYKNGIKNITKDVLVEFGKIKKISDRVKILSNGSLSCQDVSVEVDFCSNGALKKIEAVNGRVVFLSGCSVNASLGAVE
jgi:large subunit ribosomal protein L15